MNVTEVVDANLRAWVPGTRLYQTEENSHFVVCADLGEYTDARLRIIRRHTVIHYTNERGRATDMTPDFEFPPGTDHETALSEAGFTLVSEGS